MENVTDRPLGRGDVTKDKLIAAALELFGRRGFEGVGAREITAAAGVPLSAIPYHFTTKEALYRAVVHHVCQRMGHTLEPAVVAASAAIDASPTEAKVALATFRRSLLEVFAATPEAEAWAKVLLREHLDPGPAYDLVYEDAGRGAVELIAALTARATGRDRNDQAVVLEAFALMGEVLAFRTLQQAVLRRLSWRAIGNVELEAIDAVLSNRSEQTGETSDQIDRSAIDLNGTGRST